jgi:hypothetical protein
MFGLETDIFLLLSFCLLAACAFEFINGFHDTANSIATVVSTKVLTPRLAIMLAAVTNLVGVENRGFAGLASPRDGELGGEDGVQARRRARAHSRRGRLKRGHRCP